MGARNRDGIHSLESIPGLHKHFKILSLGRSNEGGGESQTEYIVNLCVVVLLTEGAIFQGALFSRDLFLMHKCLNRDHHSCDNH